MAYLAKIAIIQVIIAVTMTCNALPITSQSDKDKVGNGRTGSGTPQTISPGLPEDISFPDEEFSGQDSLDPFSGEQDLITTSLEQESPESSVLTAGVHVSRSTPTTTEAKSSTSVNVTAQFSLSDMNVNLDKMKKYLNITLDHYCNKNENIRAEMRGRNMTSCEELAAHVVSGNLDPVFQLPEPSKPINHQTLYNLAVVVRTQITRMLLYARAVLKARQQERRLLSCDYLFGAEKCSLDAALDMCNTKKTLQEKLDKCNTQLKLQNKTDMCNTSYVQEDDFICGASEATNHTLRSLEYVIGLMFDVYNLTDIFRTKYIYMHLLYISGDQKDLQESEVEVSLSRNLTSMREVRLLALGALHNLDRQRVIAKASMNFLYDHKQLFAHLFNVTYKV